MKNYKLLMTAAIFALASSLDAMPAKKGRENPSSSSMQGAVPVAESGAASVVEQGKKGVQILKDRNEELEGVVPKLVALVTGAREEALAQKIMKEEAEEERANLISVHDDVVREKEKNIRELSGRIVELTEDAERAGGELGEEIRELRDQQAKLLAERDAELKKRTDLEKSFAEFSVTEAELLKHEESRKSVKALLDGTADFLAKLEAQ